MAENTVQQPKTNPLLGVLRQPKIFIKLPSGGRFWPEGSINTSVNGEYPVYSMTARDELILKTPDALLNGQAMVTVIQNCIPNILDAWNTPQIDLDTVLVAIRLATYGETMTMQINHPSLDGQQDYEVNIREILEQCQTLTAWEDRFEVRPDLVVYLRPLPYKVYTQVQIAEFEARRLVQMVNDSALSEEQKLEQFTESFKKLTSRTLGVLSQSIYRIESTAGIVEEPEFIKEFVEQCDADMFDKIRTHLEKLSDANRLKPLTINSTPEMLEKGAPEKVEVPFTFDISNFFG